MNCNKPRMNMGGYVPSGFGQFSEPPPMPPSADQEKIAQMLQLVQNAGKLPMADAPKAKPRQGMNWGQLGQMAGMGALAGLGGKTGVAMAPIMALLMQMPQFKQMLSGKTPGFNPNAKTPVIDDGKYGG